MAKPIRLGTCSLRSPRSLRCSPAAPASHRQASQRFRFRRQGGRRCRPRHPRAGRAHDNDTADGDRLRRARGREDARRRRLPHPARQRLFRRRPLRFGRSRLQGFADDLRQPAAGRAQARAGRDRPGQERRGRRLARCRPRACSMPPITAWRWRLPGAPATPSRCSRRRPAPRAPTRASARIWRWPMPCPATGRSAGTIAAQDVPGRPARRPHPAVDAARQAGACRRPGRGADRRHAGRQRSGPAGPPRARQGRCRLAQAAAGSPSSCRLTVRSRAAAALAEAAPVPAARDARSAAAAGRSVARRCRRPSAAGASAGRSLPPLPRPKPGRLRRHGRQVRSGAEAGQGALRSACRPPAALAIGKAVVQLGAYKSPQYVDAAWSQLTQQVSGAARLSAAARPLRFAQGHLLPPVGQGLRQPARGARPLPARSRRRGGSCFVRGSPATRRSRSPRAKPTPSSSSRQAMRTATPIST